MGKLQLGTCPPSLCLLPRASLKFWYRCSCPSHILSFTHTSSGSFSQHSFSQSNKIGLPSNLIGKITEARSKFLWDWPAGWLSPKTQVWGTLLFMTVHKESSLNFTQNVIYGVHYLHWTKKKKPSISQQCGIEKFTVTNVCCVARNSIHCMLD